MHKRIFKIVADTLLSIAKKTGLTYNEVNVILYYFVIPFSWFIMLDILFGFHYLTISSIIFTIGFVAGCRNFRAYSDWLFERSVAFLNYFNKYGSNYVKSSVWICLSLPVLIYAVLIFLILKN